MYYLTLHCHHQYDSCIEMGSNVGHVNVSLIMEERSHDQTVHMNHNLKREPKQNRTKFTQDSVRKSQF